jgi:uncharacterized membrane protein
MRIARPILLVSTPVGVVFGLHEAWRLAGPAMAVLMAAMLAAPGRPMRRRAGATATN